MKLTFIVPRYGENIIGGAEKLIRQIAMELSLRKHEVTVLTTCATDLVTWHNDLPAGKTHTDGLTLYRFPVSQLPDYECLYRLNTLLQQGVNLTSNQERDWELNSGYSEPLLSALAHDSSSDAFIFCPYLFPSTVLGIKFHPERSVAIPCLHNEPYVHMRNVIAALSNAVGILLNTPEENDVLRAMEIHTNNTHIVGIGVPNPPDADSQRFIKRFGLHDPYIVYAGRREVGKNYNLLVHWLAHYNNRTSPSQPIRLVSMGTGTSDLSVDDLQYVVDCSIVDEQTKYDALAGAVAAITLSTNESFSYLLMESWLCNTPVIVNANCPVTSAHCKRSGGGIPVNSQAMFQEALQLLRTNETVRSNLAAAGNSYVKANYSVPTVMDRIETSLNSILQNATSIGSLLP